MWSSAAYVVFASASLEVMSNYFELAYRMPAEETNPTWYTTCWLINNVRV